MIKMIIAALLSFIFSLNLLKRNLHSCGMGEKLTLQETISCILAFIFKVKTHLASPKSSTSQNPAGLTLSAMKQKPQIFNLEQMYVTYCNPAAYSLSLRLHKLRAA